MLAKGCGASEQQQQPSSRTWKTKRVSALVATSLLTTIAVAQCREKEPMSGVEYDTEQVVTNWSATHTCKPRRIYEPKSAQEVTRLLQYLYKTNSKEKLRPIGTALSPNGVGMSDDNLLSLAAIDYVNVDTANRLVTVGAGARVRDVLAALDKHGLTLENFSSIQEQQMGGWTQVAAHGTGCSLPTVEDMIVRMQLATPTEGLLTLSPTLNGNLFSFAKVGLGALGVVTELTLKCVPKHQLKEHTYAVIASQLTAKDHIERLKHYRHVRYMWIPHTKDVIVVVSNPVSNKSDPASSIVQQQQKLLQQQQKQQQPANQLQESSNRAVYSQKPTAPLIDLLLRLQPETALTSTIVNASFSTLRDMLLNIAPLDVMHVAAVNQAEAAFWRLSTGTRQADSTQILGFDCGGEQLVLEVAFPIGTLTSSSASSTSMEGSKDLEFVHKLLALIQEHQIAAHAPIEQRWTARSSSPMSPAYSTNPEEIFSWVGIILYLPAGQNEDERAKIRRHFAHYVEAMQPLLEEYEAHAHWAKIELDYGASQSSSSSSSSASGSFDGRSWWEYLTGGGLWSSLVSIFNGPSDSPSTSSTACTTVSTVLHKNLCDTKFEQQRVRDRIQARYPVTTFNTYRQVLDPRGLLSNALVEGLFGQSTSAQAPKIAKRTK